MNKLLIIMKLKKRNITKVFCKEDKNKMFLKLMVLLIKVFYLGTIPNNTTKVLTA